MRLTAMITLLAALALAGCQQSDDDVPTAPVVTAPDAPMVGTLGQQSCEARGGTFRRTGASGLMTCVVTPPDAGQSCRTSSDCVSECLARSRTCAPLLPLVGCNEILDATGRALTLCRD